MNNTLISRHEYHYPDSHNSDLCKAKNDYDGNIGLRISSIFVIMIFSSIGVFFPLIISKIRCLKISLLYYFIKFFGTGIIIGTAFVHLLQPAFKELGSPCLTGVWRAYNFSPVLCIVGVLTIFLLELFSLRYIHLKCAAKSIDITSTLHTRIPFSDSNGDSSEISKNLATNIKNDLEKQNLFNKYMIKKNLVTFFILELGIIFHSIIIGFTLAVTANKEFITLYIVTSFHQMFEGLGLGARLFDISHYNDLTYNRLFAFVYSIITSASISIGLAIKNLHNSRSSTMVVSGIFNSLSSGVLLYAGLVELLAEDFIVNSEIRNGSLIKLLYTIFCLILGFITMAVIGIWA